MFIANRCPCVSRRRHRGSGRRHFARAQIGRRDEARIERLCEEGEEELIEKAKEAREALTEALRLDPRTRSCAWPSPRSTPAPAGGARGVSANPSPIVDSATLTILPATAVMYPGLPTTFVLSGGTGAYILTSSNQAILPFSGGLTGRSVTLVPTPVTAETQVTLTLRDTGAAAPVTATVTVKPGTVNNDLTVTPSSTQDASCSPAVCSGADAQAKVTISQGGIPLAARGVRFQVVTGSYAFVESPPLSRFETPGVPTSLITTTDETGTARAALRVTALAPSQTATMRVTDMESGAYREASFAIAQFTGNTPAFFTLP